MNKIQTHEDWISPSQILDENETDLVGVDGGAFSVMCFVNRALKNSGNSRKVIDAYMDEAMSGDYNHLLVVSMEYLGA